MESRRTRRDFRRRERDADIQEAFGAGQGERGERCSATGNEMRRAKGCQCTVGACSAKVQERLACESGRKSTRMGRGATMRTSPENHSVPLHDVVVTRSTIYTLRRVCLHALEVAHEPATCRSRHGWTGVATAALAALSHQPGKWRVKLVL